MEQVHGMSVHDVRDTRSDVLVVVVDVVDLSEHAVRDVVVDVSVDVHLFIDICR